MGQSNQTIGLIAGGRQFPVMVAKGIKERGHRLVVAGFTGHTNMEVAPLADVWQELKLGKLSKLIDFFKSNGVERVIMAGTINKPKAMDVRHLDMRALKLVFQNKNKGDSGILGILAQEFEKEGMPVIPAHKHVPELLAPRGVLTKRSPSDEEMSDIRFGWNAAKSLGKLDIGQCVVVREGVVAAVEALEGTDAAVRRGCELGGSGCSVIKVFKPGQQKRIDLPSFGLETIRTMVDGGATCFAYEAEKSLFFDRDEAISLADRHGVAIVGVHADEMDGYS